MAADAVGPCASNHLDGLYLKGQAAYHCRIGRYENAEESERDVLVCDENGFAQSKKLPYGTYIVRQTKGWEGRELMDDFEVYIAQDSQTYLTGDERDFASVKEIKAFIKKDMEAEG